MRLFLSILCVTLFTATGAMAQITDSSGQPSGRSMTYGDAVYSSTWERIRGKPQHYPTRWQDVENKPVQTTRWPTWNEVSGKPAQATRWPSWSEVSGKPSSFPPAAHHHDSRYVRKDASGSLSGNLNVSGTVSGNRIVTGDVGGEGWCKANSAGRIQCTYSSPLGKSCSSGKYVAGINSNGSLNCKSLPSSGGGGGGNCPAPNRARYDQWGNFLGCEQPGQ